MPDPMILHATAVAVGPRALLIRGRSGAGSAGGEAPGPASAPAPASAVAVLARCTAEWKVASSAT